MLDWKNLTNRQRFTTAFFTLFTVVAALVATMSVRDGLSATIGLRDILASIFVCAFMLGILLDPAAVRGKATALYPHAMPLPCKVLYAIALLAMVTRGVLGVFGGF